MESRFLNSGWIAIVLANVVAAVLATMVRADRFSAENGILETAQVLMCAVGAGLFAFAISLLPRLKEADSYNLALRSSSIALLCISLIALFREIDFRKMPGPDWLYMLTGSWVRDTIVISGILLVLAYMVLRRQDLPNWLRLTFSWHALPLWIGGTLLFVSSVIIDHNVTFEGSVLIEEWLELNGFMFILWAAARHARLASEVAPKTATSKPTSDICSTVVPAE